MWNQIGTDDRAYGIECGVQGNVETLRLRKYLLPIPLSIGMPNSQGLIAYSPPVV